IARVNSGTLRRAVFHYETNPPPVHLSIAGLDYLRAIILTDESPPIEQVPLVTPAVKFALPSERVTSAGVDGTRPQASSEALAGMRNTLPLIRAIGFNGV